MSRLGGEVAVAFQISTFTIQLLCSMAWLGVQWRLFVKYQLSLTFFFTFTFQLLCSMAWLGVQWLMLFKYTLSLFLFFTFQLLQLISWGAATGPTFWLSTTEQFVGIMIVAFISSKCSFISQ